MQKSGNCKGSIKLSTKRIVNYRFDPQPFIKDGVCYAKVRLVPDEVKRQLRHEFNSMDKGCFELDGIYDHKKHNFHHQIPLQLGGKNSTDNLVIMNKTEHDILHKCIINPQVYKMMKGEIRTIMLPVVQGGSLFELSSTEFHHFLTEFFKMYPVYQELRPYIDKQTAKNIKMIQMKKLCLDAKQHA